VVLVKLTKPEIVKLPLTHMVFFESLIVNLFPDSTVKSPVINVTSDRLNQPVELILSSSTLMVTPLHDTVSFMIRSVPVVGEQVLYSTKFT